ncbi:hypothetical protein M9H77_16437 [Catharanthus roseus]|uniref:Uncharacterized protein n=1 Tax=Catharanthus roseus TaxID=4058 RepID=A0ACC0B1S4_CATRO|nr:hypothetical protein M9H77_16437 [Catharanthus roseus]
MSDLNTRSAFSRLHYMWLVSRTRASSDDVDGFLTLRVDPLEEGCSTLRAWPNRYLRGHRIILYGGTDGQRYNKPQKFWVWSFGLSLSGRKCVSTLHSCTRAVCKVFLSFLMPRGTQIPYSAAVNLVAGLGESQVVSEL